MFANIWAFIRLVLALLGLRDEFLDHQEAARAAETQERNQERDAAVDKQKAAQSEKEFDDAQSDIVRRKP